MRVQRCKGTRDLSPEEMDRFRLIEGAFRDSCLRRGYKEVRTPTIEYLHLFTSVGTLTPSMLGRVYSFLDWDGWSGERVVLRPDGTIPVARLYIDTVADKSLARLFYVANTFIFEETGKKNRERWQCGTELIGAGSPLADAELILLALEVLRKLRFEGVELRLSHAGLIKELLAKFGLSPEEQARVFDQILDGDAEALSRIKAKRPEVEDVLFPLLSLKGKSSGFLRNMKALSARSLPEIQSHLANFIAVTDILEALGCDYQVDIASGAQFEYYTGLIFQLFVGEEKIGGGGRYDALIPAMGGGDIPASGFALYLDRLLNLIKPEILTEGLAQRVLVRAGSGELVKEAFAAAGRLREAGYIAEIDLDGREAAGLRWVLAVQDKKPAFVLWDKVKSSKVEVQDMGEVLALLEEESASKDSFT